MADMRKERRAPASLKVKYKSATVDQFIDQFGTDVSTGGMFIKTKTPLEIGALLKLELQLSDASPVIQGVGRVCWRRMPSDDLPQLPPGMGIKFVKLEDASLSTVERIVGGRGGAPSRFDQTDGAEVAEPSTPPPPPDASNASVQVAPKPGPPPSPAKQPMASQVMSRPAGSLPGPSTTGSAPALRGGGALPGPAFGKAPPKPPAGIPSRAPGPRPPAPFTSGAPSSATAAALRGGASSSGTAPALRGGASSPIPSVRAGATAAANAPAPTASSSSSTSALRAPVAGLFSDSPMSRATPEPSAHRSARSSFFPPAANVNGNAAPPAPAGVSSRPPPAPVARSVPTAGIPRIAGAFGASPARGSAPQPGPTRAEEEDAIDRLFEEVVQPRSSAPPPGSRHPRTTPLIPAADDAELDDVLGDTGTVPPRARPPAPHIEDELYADDAGGAAESFGENWSSAGAASALRGSPSANALRSPGLPQDDAPRAQPATQHDDHAPADFGDDQFGEADIGAMSGAPSPLHDDLAPPVLNLSVPAPPMRRSSALPWIVLALVVLAAGGFIFMQRKPAPPPPVAAPPAVAAPSASAVGAAAPTAAAVPVGTDQAATGNPAAPGESAVPAANPAAPAAAAPAAEVETVSVEVSSVPRGAEIDVAGKLVGTTPMRVQLPVGVATELSVRSPGFAAMTRPVTASSTSEPERFKLEPLPYNVRVTTDPPGAELSFEGHTAIAPGPLELGHIDGSVMMSVAKSGYQRMMRPLRLEEFVEQDGQMRAQAEVRLSPLPGGERSSSSSRRARSRGEAPPAPAAPSPEGSAAPATPGPAGSVGSVVKVPDPAPEAAPAAPAPAAPVPPAAPTPPTPPALPPSQ